MKGFVRSIHLDLISFLSDKLEAAMKIVRDDMESHLGKAQFHARWQFRLLIAGAVFFLAWHILRMVLSTDGL